MKVPKKEEPRRLILDEPGWLSLYEAAQEIAQQSGVSWAEALLRLRQGCIDQKLHSMKAPIDDGNTLPREFWVRVAHSEWREREVDYDGPDADGCKTVVMIDEADFRSWLKGVYPEQPIRKAQARGKVPLIMGYLTEMFPTEKYPNGVPDPAHCPRKKLKDELIARDKKKLASLHDDTLRRAIDTSISDHPINLSVLVPLTSSGGPWP
jgi:hypothetical protein